MGLVKNMKKKLEERKREIKDLKMSLPLSRDKRTVDTVATLYENQDISLEVLIEYLEKNILQKQVIDILKDDNDAKDEVFMTDVRKPLISVIIPTYAGYLPICQTIDSVLKQKYQNLEIIVMDDVGNSVTKEMMIQKYKGNKKIRYYQSKNKVFSGSDKRKIGFLKSRGEYVVFLDHDDYYIDSNFFGRAIKFFEEKDESGKIRNESFAFYSANAFIYHELDDFYEIKKLNVSGAYLGEEYLYGLQLKYDKPLSVFPTVFVKEKLLQSNMHLSTLLADSITYMYACLSGKAYISDSIVGAYRVGTNTSTKNQTFERMLSNLDEKRMIMLEARKRYPGKDWNKWLLKQTEWAISFTYKNKKKFTVGELWHVELWGFRYCRKEFKKCGEFLLSKYIEEKSDYSFSEDDNKEKNKRLQKYYDLLNLWIINKNDGNRIDSYLLKRGWKKICIYGYGEIGKRLYEELLQSNEISIEAIIDNSFRNQKVVEDIKCYTLQDNLPSVDVTIITPIFQIDDIIKDLNRKGVYNCVSIYDILCEM